MTPEALAAGCDLNAPRALSLSLSLSSSPSVHMPPLSCLSARYPLLKRTTQYIFTMYTSGAFCSNCCLSLAAQPRHISDRTIALLVAERVVLREECAVIKLFCEEL